MSIKHKIRHIWKIYSGFFLNFLKSKPAGKDGWSVQIKNSVFLQRLALKHEWPMVITVALKSWEGAFLVCIHGNITNQHYRGGLCVQKVLSHSRDSPDIHLRQDHIMSVSGFK